MSNIQIEEKDNRNLITQIREVKLKRKMSVYEFSYSDGSKVVFERLDTAVMRHGEAYLTGLPTYCHPCKRLMVHVYYYSGDTKCLACGNHLGENDTRPYAKVLQGKWPNAKEH